MRKFMKICGISALIMIGTGMIFAIIGGGIRGISFRQLINDARHGKLSWDTDQWRDWGIAAGGGLLDELNEVNYDINENSIFDEQHEIFRGDMEKYSLGSGIDRIDAEIGGCEFLFCESDDSQFYVSAENAGKFQCYVKNDTLYIKSVRTTKKINGDYDLDKIRQSSITLYIPGNSSFKDVDIEAGAAFVEMKDFSTQKMELELGAGEALGEGIRADKAELSVGMGAIELSDMQIGKLSVETGMGSVEFKGSISEKADIECSMGSIYMEIEGSEQDFDYKIESAMGSINIGDRDYAGLAREKKINNNAGKSIEVECSMGSVEIDFTED